METKLEKRSLEQVQLDLHYSLSTYVRMGGLKGDNVAAVKKAAIGTIKQYRGIYEIDATDEEIMAGLPPTIGILASEDETQDIVTYAMARVLASYLQSNAGRAALKGQMQELAEEYERDLLPSLASVFGKVESEEDVMNAFKSTLEGIRLQEEAAKKAAKK